ncbi:MAG: trigger factor [gamma proteobacterium symbiont of Ctena orbiculata]|uniref:Trigger factor n=1 Tax=Candidatus Thiodiazotropha taylori TaxID=2792791 RepID=A0A944MBJ4_9GAMM|nr:trigger factor [Candidatus Thiodiazotropha taylori]PUB86978.1 MAG: trigger factor [gamma proteobacterium symbiont of Ctena orbiculata]MBT2989694.1 trigger factor [Candidatus Thiodiazotropha taylori]MBT2995966.1 trigger factor [Candidatus Thiodiazotropha taylori]MBT2999282.1 trigger factor [Candidatus Thiodiazotropha taylori]
MQVSVESGEGLERRVTVELPAEQIEAEVTKRLQQIGRTAKLDGFRPGKVPMKLLRRNYGGQVLQEVYGQMIETSYQEAIQQEKLQPAGMPKIEPKEASEEGLFSYVATLEVMPEIELVKLAGEIKRPITEISAEDIEDMIGKLRKQRATWSGVDRAAAEGDQVKISFKGLVDGEAFEGGSAENVDLVLGSKRMIEGFESGLVGMVKEEKRSIDLKFPEDYRVEELAGKPVTFEVEVSEISEEVLPPVDDDFAKEFGASEGVEKLKEDIRENMERELSQRVQARIKSQAMDLVYEQNQIDVPKALVEEEIEALSKQAREQMGANTGSFELPRDMFEEQAKRRVSLGLLIGEIIKQNGIQVDNDRVRKTIEEYAASYEQPDEVVKFYYGNQQQLASVQNIVLEDQVVDWIMEQVEVVDDQTTFAALTEQG